VCALSVFAAVYFFVIEFQRELSLVAVNDVQFYDGQDPANVIFQLPNGASAIIVRCEDTKSLIVPVIGLDDGRTAYLLSGNFKIHSRPTGLLSRPRYPGCPGF
jgi:hypothetical protein